MALISMMTTGGKAMRSTSFSTGEEVIASNFSLPPKRSSVRFHGGKFFRQAAEYSLSCAAAARKVNFLILHFLILRRKNRKENPRRISGG
jgi:hypothetical protein